MILPYLDERPLYDRYRFDEPWDSPHNRDVADDLKYSAPFFCYDEHAHGGRTTSYVAVVGDGTMWPRDGGTLTRGDVRDSAALTAHVVEMADSGIYWSQPADLDFDAMTFVVNAKSKPGLRSFHPGEDGWFGRSGPRRVNAAFVDGVSRSLGEGTPPGTVRSLLLHNDGGPTGF